MTPPLWNFGLKPEQGFKIATILANWSMVDNEVGHTLQFLSGILHDHDGSDLIHVLDLSKKVEILNTRRKAGRTPARMDDLIVELVYVVNRYRNDRNMLAHGTINVNNTDAVAYSASRRRTLDLSNLDAILDESHYATWVAHSLILAQLGVTPDPLPPRPPERPLS